MFPIIDLKVGAKCNRMCVCVLIRKYTEVCVCVCMPIVYVQLDPEEHGDWTTQRSSSMKCSSVLQSSPTALPIHWGLYNWRLRNTLECAAQ